MTNVNILKDLLSKMHPEIIKNKQAFMGLKHGFNVFKIISDSYYKENFHSDIISEFLNYTDSNNERTNLKMFVEFLNSRKNNEPQISFSNYSEIEITREEGLKQEDGRIDVFIKDNQSKNAIIVENKINYALDMSRQIPRYYNIAKSKGFKVMAILYLTLDSDKKATSYDWNTEDAKAIKPLLIEMPAYDFKSDNLCSGWLDKCILNSYDLNLSAILRQYKDLLKYLKINNMNNEILEKFYSYVKGNNEYYSSALDLKTILADMCQFRANKILNHFVDKSRAVFNSPSVFKYEGIWRAKFSDCIISQQAIWIDIECYEKKTIIYIKDIGIEEGAKERLSNLAKEIALPETFRPLEGYNNYLHQAFAYPEQEEELYSSIEKLLTNLTILIET